MLVDLAIVCVWISRFKQSLQLLLMLSTGCVCRVGGITSNVFHCFVTSGEYIKLGCTECASSLLKFEYRAWARD